MDEGCPGVGPQLLEKALRPPELPLKVAPGFLSVIVETASLNSWMQFMFKDVEALPMWRSLFPISPGEAWWLTISIALSSVDVTCSGPVPHWPGSKMAREWPGAVYLKCWVSVGWEQEAKFKSQLGICVCLFWRGEGTLECDLPPLVNPEHAPDSGWPQARERLQPSPADVPVTVCGSVCRGKRSRWLRVFTFISLARCIWRLLD